MLVVHCDHCGCEGPYGYHEFDLVIDARKAGWVMGDWTGRDFCPNDAHWADHGPFHN